LIAIDQSSLLSDDLPALGGENQRPPIDLVQVNFRSVLVDEKVIGDEGCRSVPHLGVFTELVAEIGQTRRFPLNVEPPFVGVNSPFRLRGAVQVLAEAGTELLRCLKVLCARGGRFDPHSVNVENVEFGAPFGAFDSGAQRCRGMAWGRILCPGSIGDEREERNQKQVTATHK
jgi:hypothetical protein